MSFTKEQLQEMAAQLSRPQGDEGIKVANMMHQSNFGMTKSTVEALKIKDNEKILELGHGNGKHIPFVLEQAENIRYFGLEIAETMKKEAEQLNESSASSFYIFNGTLIPFEDRTFEKAFTVNTIYFWENPVQLLENFYRALKPGGLLAIGYAQKEFMEMLPFTKYGFTLYCDNEFQELIAKTSFKLVNLSNHKEQITSKAGDKVERLYTVATLKR